MCAKEVIETTPVQQFKVGTPVSKVFEDDDGEMRPFAGKITGYDSQFQVGIFCLLC